MVEPTGRKYDGHGLGEPGTFRSRSNRARAVDRRILLAPRLGIGKRALITSDSWATQAYNDPGRARPLLDGNTTPSPFRIDATKLSPTHGRFEIEPLEEGYGVT